MFSDVFVVTGFGLIEPILAIFIKEDLIGGTIFAAGLASMLFLLTKSMIQLPFSRYVDSHEERVLWLMIGMILITIVPFLYLNATHIHTIYIAQLILGVGSGLAYPTWLGLWSRHLDNHQESFEWSLYSSLVGIGTAVTAVLGATIAELWGFKLTFMLAGAMSVIGCIILLTLDKELHNSNNKCEKKRK